MPERTLSDYSREGIRMLQEANISSVAADMTIGMMRSLEDPEHGLDASCIQFCKDIPRDFLSIIVQALIDEFGLESMLDATLSLLHNIDA